MQRSALVLIVLAAVLGVGAWLVSRPGGSSPSVSPAVERVDRWSGLDAGTLARIDVARGAGGAATLWRVGDGWTLDADGWRWPADASRVRAAVRLLAQAASGPAVADGSGSSTSVMGSATTVTMISPAGVGEMVRLSSSVLGGRSLMEVPSEHKGPPTYRSVDAGLAAMFSPEGLAAWRSDRPLASADVSRVEVSQSGSGSAEGGGGRGGGGGGPRTLAVRRIRGRWVMQSPIAADADADAVAKMIVGLQDVRVRRFVPGEDADIAASLRSASAVISMTGGDGRTIALRVGGPADAGGATLFAEISGTAAEADRPDGAGADAKPEGKPEASRDVGPGGAFGPAVVVIDRAAVEAAVPGVADLLPRRACATPAADVTIVRVYADPGAVASDAGERAVIAAGPGNGGPGNGGPGNTGAPGAGAAAVFTRGIGGWSRDGRVLVPTDSDAVQRLVRLLSEERSASVRVEAIGAEGMGLIELTNAAGTAREFVGVGTAPAVDIGGKRQAALVVRTGAVWRAYPRGAESGAESGPESGLESGAGAAARSVEHLVREAIGGR